MLRGVITRGVSGGIGGGQDGTVTSLTVEAVRQTLGEFFKRVPTGQCANCGAHAPRDQAVRMLTE